MTKYIKSHRDQKVRPLVVKSLSQGCTILEIDVQQACGTLVLGHNWRPKLPFLFDCTLKEYLDDLVQISPPGQIYVQLDIKEILYTNSARKKFANDIVNLLYDYKQFIVPLVSANDGLGRPETMQAVYNILVGSGWNVPKWIDWKIDKDITVVDLWK